MLITKDELKKKEKKLTSKKNELKKNYQHCHNRPWGPEKKWKYICEQRGEGRRNTGTSRRHRRRPPVCNGRPSKRSRRSCMCCMMIRPWTSSFWSATAADGGDGGSCGDMVLFVIRCGWDQFWVQLELTSVEWRFYPSGSLCLAV